MASKPPPKNQTELEKRLQASLTLRGSKGILRKLPLSSERELVDFTSNDYLSLVDDAVMRGGFVRRVVEANESANAESSSSKTSSSSRTSLTSKTTLSKPTPLLGSTGSRLLVNPPLHASLEDEATILFNSPAALLFNSGYDANVGFFSCVPSEGDVVLYDEYIHASVHDGMRGSRVARGDRRKFGHNDVKSFGAILDGALGDLVKRRKEGKGGMVFVAVEALYSMDGTVCPLLDFVDVLKRTLDPAGIEFHIVIDEAHSTGVYGPLGRGLISLLSLDSPSPSYKTPLNIIRLHTFGKALASSGALLLCTPTLKSFLVNYARPLVYSTALNHPSVMACCEALQTMRSGETERRAEVLLGKAREFVGMVERMLSQQDDTRGKGRKAIVNLPDDIFSSKKEKESTGKTLPTPIVPLLTPHAKSLQAHLFEAGINARAITYPTVPVGLERVRVCLHYANTREEMERLVEEVARWADGVLVKEAKGERDVVLKREEKEKRQESGGPGGSSLMVFAKL